MKISTEMQGRRPVSPISERLLFYVNFIGPEERARQEKLIKTMDKDFEQAEKEPMSEVARLLDKKLADRMKHYDFLSEPRMAMTLMTIRGSLLRIATAKNKQEREPALFTFRDDINLLIAGAGVDMQAFLSHLASSYQTKGRPESEFEFVKQAYDQILGQGQPIRWQIAANPPFELVPADSEATVSWVWASAHCLLRDISQRPERLKICAACIDIFVDTTSINNDRSYCYKIECAKRINAIKQAKHYRKKQKRLARRKDA